MPHIWVIGLYDQNELLFTICEAKWIESSSDEEEFKSHEFKNPRKTCRLFKLSGYLSFNKNMVVILLYDTYMSHLFLMIWMNYCL